MRDDPEQDVNPNDPDEIARIVAQNQRQLRLAEQAMRGMTTQFGTGSGQFISGEFKEQVKLTDPVMPVMPEDMRLLEAAVSIIDVSSDPQVSTPLDDIEPVAVPGEPDGLAPVEPEVEPPEIPVVATADPTSESLTPDRFWRRRGEASVEFEVDTPADTTEVISGTSLPESQPPVEPPAAEIPKPKSGWPPGLGFTVEDPVERAKVRDDAIKQHQKELQKEVKGKEIPAGEKQARPSDTAVPKSPRAESTEGQRRPPVPHVDMGVGATGRGFVPPDFGDAGSKSYQDPTASQVSIAESVSDAIDTVDNNMELILELLRRFTLNLQRHGELLNQLIDKTDTEDDADEF